MADCTIREATRGDFDAVLALWRSIDFHTSLLDTPETLQQFHDFSPDMFLVAEEDGRIVGTVIAPWNGWRGFLARLATDPASRRTGIARALVEEAERRLAARGARRIYALVATLSPPTVPFWKAVGYEEIDTAALYGKSAGDD
ncbi:MAG TPA: GNAT family N-acetyltransferase [Dehalococcoidia bacterium]|nr:GNAT family N-acetyltransferase [Dehalococcoidia bacterium]